MMRPSSFVYRLGLAVSLAPFLSFAAEPAPPSSAPPPASTNAARSAPSDDLPWVIITATRQREPLLDAPVSSSVVTRRALDERRPVNLPDALREVPGVMVQKTATGQGSPFIRGFTGFRNLLLIDGVRLNNSVFREGPNQYWNTVDSFGLDRLEIIRGEGSTLYGTDAIGGTVQAFTPDPLRDGAGPGETFLHGDALYRFGSATESHIGRMSARFGSGESWGLQFGVTAKTFGDLDAADLGRLPKTGYDELDFDAKLAVKLSEPWTLTLAYQQIDQDDAWRTHRTIYAKSWEGTSVGTDRVHAFDQGRQLAYVAVEGADLDGWVSDAHFTVSWHRQSEDRRRTQTDGRRDLEGFDVDTAGATLDLVSPMPWGPLSWGGAFYQDNVDSYRTAFAAGSNSGTAAIQGPVADDATYRLIDAYAQQKLVLGDRLDLFIGARFSHAEADAGRVADPLTGDAVRISNSWDEVVGSARFLWRALDKDRLHLFGGVSQGFRAPNLSDLTRFDIARSDEVEIPSPGLDPEKFLTFELGGRSRSGPFTVDAAVFYTHIRDLIVRQPTGAVIDGDSAVRKRNAADGFVWGFELDSSVRIHRDWNVFAKAAWTDGESDSYPTSAPVSRVEPISRMLPLTGQLGLRYAKGRFWGELFALGATEQDRLNAADRGDSQRIPPGGTPGYVTLNARAGLGVGEHLEFQVALENLTDTAYRVHGSGQNEPGFGASASVQLRF
jgi:hemoglobin/transferrin/lactoferrin receptor protein